MALIPPFAAEYGTRWMPRVALDETLTIVPRPLREKLRDHRVAAPQRRHQRAPDLRFDLPRLEAVVGPHADRATDIVDQDVDAPETSDGFGHCHGGPS